jgi:hypothetical protein
VEGFVMATPKRRPKPDAVSITGRRTTRKSDVIQKPDSDDAALESYEQNVERPSPDVRETDGPDAFPPAPARMPPD